jgi:pyruvate formate lyase activating enzyme
LKSVAVQPIVDITPFTILDFSGYLACIVWFAKCNMRCPYCYNRHIVLGNGVIGTDELLRFLHTRIGRLEGVVLSGGECTLYPDLPELCRKIKEFGFKVKIDTNGTCPDRLKTLVEMALIDFVSLDFKSPPLFFKTVTHSGMYDKVLQSLRLLIRSDINFEVRTTVHTALLDENAVNDMIDILSNEGYNGVYYLQNYFDTENSLGNMQNNPRRLNRKLLTDKIRVEFRN